MDNTTAYAADPQQFALAQRKLILDNRIRNGVNWFYWIAGFSLVNTVIYLVGGGLHFVVGLAVTQFIDAIMKDLVQRIGSGSEILQILGLVLDVGIAGIFALLGFFGRKRYGWVVIAGMVFYAIDAVLMLVFQDYLAAAFHAWALWGLWGGWRAIRELAVLEKSNPTAPVEVLRNQYALIQPAIQPVENRRNRRITSIIFGMLIFLVFVAGLAYLSTR
jgi:hypothetical protein